MRPLLLLLFLICSFCELNAQDMDTLVYQQESAESLENEETGNEESQPQELHQLQEAEQLESTQDYRATPIEVRRFDREKWKEVVGAVNYNEAPPKKEKEKSKRSPGSIGPWGGALLRVIAYLVIGGVVVLLLYLVLKNMTGKAKARTLKVRHVDVEAPVENIEEIDIQSMLRQARADGNWRLAVRLYYLGLLKNLNDSGMIHWKKDKTNHDYLSELFAKDCYYEEVKGLTLSYEQVWYGERVLTAESFDKIAVGFNTIHDKINTLKSS